MKYTYRELFTRHLPEPYRSQAVINTLSQGLPVDEALCPYDDVLNVLLEAFAWSQTPEGHAYWSAASRGEFQTPELRLEVGKRYLTRDGRTAEIVGEDPVCSPESCYRFDGSVEGETGFCWSTAGRYDNQRENPLDLVSEIVEAAPAYRLLEPGEIIREGDERLLRLNEYAPEEWRAVRGSKGEPFDPATYYPTRRPLKTYEDA